MAQQTIIIKDQRAFTRELKRAGEDAAKFQKQELLEAGALVEKEAHQLIREQRLVGGERSTGRLDRLTRTGVTARGVFVRSSANRDGFNYPGFYEFARGRAFLYPALQRKAPQVIARLELMLDRIAARFNNS